VPNDGNKQRRFPARYRARAPSGLRAAVVQRRGKVENVARKICGSSKGIIRLPLLICPFRADPSKPWEWRQKLGKLAKECGFRDLRAFKLRFGPHWAWLLHDVILAVNLDPAGAVP